MKQKIIQVTLAALMCTGANAQINTGSNGSDGALDFSAYANLGTNIVINMTDHPNGIYQYTDVNIPSGVYVSFIPNANNTPVTWLVQSNVVINGQVIVVGQNSAGRQGGLGGPGGYTGGEGGSGDIAGSPGLGPGGGSGDTSCGSEGSYNYGNQFLIPLLGGSGGGGGSNGGSGGGGAILIAASNSITVGGAIIANAGNVNDGGGSGGSGGAIRLVAYQLFGSGQITANGGGSGACYNGGPGRIRFDVYNDEFNGSFSGQFSQGSQFVIIPGTGLVPQLTITSIGGIPVSTSPTGQTITPDAIFSAQQNNPITIIVSCVNLPLNTPISVSVWPTSGSPAVSAVGSNTTGTQSSSTATVSINIPRGFGLIYATAVTGN